MWEKDADRTARNWGEKRNPKQKMTCNIISLGTFPTSSQVENKKGELVTLYFVTIYREHLKIKISSGQ